MTGYPDKCYNGFDEETAVVSGDESVWNHYVPVTPSVYTEDAIALFTEVAEGRYEIFVSELVSLEISRTPDPKRREMLRSTVSRFGPRELSIEGEALALAERYIAEGVIPRSAEDDAQHVAIATVANLDVIVSLNMRHIVRLKARHGINAVNDLAGFRQIDIATPGEVLEYGYD